MSISTGLKRRHVAVEVQAMEVKRCFVWSACSIA